MSRLWPDWITDWPKDMALEQFSAQNHGDYTKWQTAIEAMPQVQTDAVTLNHSAITCELSGATQTDLAQMESCLRQLHPWRKGPFQLGPLYIDTEWRSDWKWDRVLPHIESLENKLVLDVGCGNGYHCWRMLGAGAARVIGIDPSPKSVFQFYAIKHFAGEQHPVDVLPFGIEQMPKKLKAFDSVFSMGILYHRRSPMDHLLELKELLKSGGQLILETLIIEGKEGEVLLPQGRYGKMPNVWFLPSADTLISWMEKIGLRNPRMVDQCKTTTEEQRTTDWMTFDSLETFLDPEDSNKTIEGYPAPIRAVFVAEAPTS